MKLALILPWIGCFGGLVGSVLLAWRNRWSGYGFVAYVVGNLALIWLAVLLAIPALILQYLGLTAISVMGIRNWLYPTVPRRYEVYQGFASIMGKPVWVDFSVPAGTCRDDCDVAFARALLARVEHDYRSLGTVEGENPDFPREAWQREKAQGRTSLDYAEWVFRKQEEDRTYRDCAAA